MLFESEVCNFDGNVADVNQQGSPSKWASLLCLVGKLSDVGSFRVLTLVRLGLKTGSRLALFSCASTSI